MDTELDQLTDRYAQAPLIDFGVEVGRVRVETLEAFVALATVLAGVRDLGVFPGQSVDRIACSTWTTLTSSWSRGGAAITCAWASRSSSARSLSVAASALRAGCFSKLKQFRAVATRYDKRERIYQGTIDVASSASGYAIPSHDPRDTP